MYLGLYQCNQIYLMNREDAIELWVSEILLHKMTIIIIMSVLFALIFYTITEPGHSFIDYDWVVKTE